MSSEFANPDKLNQEQINALSHYLGRLKELDADVAVRATRYVIDNTDEDVLLKLGGMKEAATLFGLVHPTGATGYQVYNKCQTERVAIFHQGATAPPGPWVRLAHLFETARRAAGQPVQTPPGWPGALVLFIAEAIGPHTVHQDKTKKQWSLDTLETVFKSSGLAPDMLARAYLNLQTARSFNFYGLYSVSSLPGWKECFTRHIPAVRDSITGQDAEGRLYALNFLAKVGFDFTPVIDVLVELATGSAKTVRDRTLPLLQGPKEQARPLLENVLAEGDAATRHEAVQVLYRLFGVAVADTLRKHAEGESSERVKQTIERFLAAPTGEEGMALTDLAASLPPVETELGEVPFPDEAKAKLRAYFAEVYGKVKQTHEQQLKQWNSPERPRWMTKEPVLAPDIIESQFQSLIEMVEGKAASWSERPQWMQRHGWNKTAFDWLAPPEIKLIHVVRLTVALNLVHLQPSMTIWWANRTDLEAFRSRCEKPFGLRELDAVVATLPGGKPGMVATSYIVHNGRYHSFCDWEADAVWPVFAEYPDVLRTVLNPPTGNDHTWPQKRRTVFRVLAMFPHLPPDYIPLLWDIALGETKADRPLAQTALGTVPDKAQKILVALGDGRQQVRAVAAEWLGKIGDRSAIEPLKEAFRKEKQEVVKGAMMSALESLGADVNEFLNRDELLDEAKKNLAKKKPRGMEWVPLDRLPALHWEDTGAAVDPAIVQWWLVQSIAQKVPVPGVLLRRYLAMCRKHEAAAMARFILSAWIGQDTRMPSHEAAAEKARKEADQQWARSSQYQQYADHWKNDKENLYRFLLQNYSNELVGSANDQKGMLALVTAAGDADCVKMCEGYIRKWFGNRLAQCKALVEVLAWVRHPLAIQALLGFGTRFRTKAIRKGAEEHIAALAEREGWTIDELADRTIPDAGFERPVDESGKPVGDKATLILDYGARKFTVTLDDELQPVLTNEQGKTVKAPPAPGKDDDPEKAKGAKKAFTDAKKVVKEVIKRQSERLYEALCTQRSWRFDDWKRYLADHPILSRLCVSLAWAAFEPEKDKQPEKFIGCFRPMEDGSLTNEKDEEEKLGPDVRIRLAHTCNVPAELGQAWLTHFADYDVEPLFAQFGRPTYMLPDDKKNETDVKDFEGHMLTTFKLRGKATKLGYIRGDAEDGGCFYLYRKPFTSLGVQAVVGFTGSTLPEQDVPAALTELYFMPIKGDREAASSWAPSKLPLSKVPAVLLSECYNDMKQLAAAGTGHDPEWQKRSYF